MHNVNNVNCNAKHVWIYIFIIKQISQLLKENYFLKDKFQFKIKIQLIIIKNESVFLFICNKLCVKFKKPTTVVQK